MSNLSWTWPGGGTSARAPGSRRTGAGIGAAMVLGIALAAVPAVSRASLTGDRFPTLPATEHVGPPKGTAAATAPLPLPRLRLARLDDRPQRFDTDTLGELTTSWPSAWLLEPRGIAARTAPIPGNTVFDAAAVEGMAVTIPLPPYGVLGMTGVAAAMCYVGARWLNLRRQVPPAARVCRSRRGNR